MAYLFQSSFSEALRKTCAPSCKAFFVRNDDEDVINSCDQFNEEYSLEIAEDWDMCKMGLLEVLRMLASLGADMNAVNEYNGVSVLNVWKKPLP